VAWRRLVEWLAVVVFLVIYEIVRLPVDGPDRGRLPTFGDWRHPMQLPHGRGDGMLTRGEEGMWLTPSPRNLISARLALVTLSSRVRGA